MSTSYEPAPDVRPVAASASQLTLLFLFALVPRITGLLWGSTSGDENLSDSAKVLAGQLVPGQHFYPPLLNYVNAVAFVALFGIGRLTGVWGSIAAFRQQWFVNPTPFIFTARLVTAALGAASAPLAAMVAHRCRLPRWPCLLVGLLTALLPVDVWLSHISKCDIGMASALLLLAWTCLRKLDQPASLTADALVGGSAALALSFKHSAIFVVAPLVLGTLVSLLASGRTPWWSTLRGMILALGVCVLAWMPMNIGILIDFRNFLEYQKVQALMSQRPSSLSTAFQAAIPALGLSQNGATMPAFVAWLLTPLVRRDRRTLLIWASTAIGFAVVTSMIGTRVPWGLVLPYSLLVLVVGSITAVSLVLDDRLRVVGWSAVVLILGWSAAGTFEVTRQALAPSMSPRLAKVLSRIAEPGTTKILASSPDKMGLPIDPRAATEEWERHERLARKYKVEFPPRAAERIQRQRQPQPGDYFIRAMPAVYGGLEAYDERQVKVVKPFAWPFQTEEYDLKYWLDRGFSIFVLADEASYIHGEVEPIRRLFGAIKDKCTLVEVLPAQRPLFEESEYRVYSSKPLK
jgi:hypothetical protein